MHFLAADPKSCLVEIADVEKGALPEPWQAYRGPLDQVVGWARDYLTEPHPELGRQGPVCPYVQTSMEKRLFLLAVCPGRDLDGARIVETVMRYRDWFLEIEPCSGPDALLKTILILFPEIPLCDVSRLIDATQEVLKPEYVKKKLMIGEFHPLPPQKGGLWNPDFRPLRAPVPMLVIRHMVPTDFAFLKSEKSFVTAYLDIYGDQVPVHIKAQVQETAHAFGLELRQTGLHPQVHAALHRAGVRFRVHRHADQPFAIQGPADFARALRYPLERISKSLFLRCHCHSKYLVVVCPVDRKLKLTDLARLVGCQRLELASPEELAIVLGYPIHGVSPLAVGTVQVLMDEDLLRHETVLTAAGEVEVEVEIAPADLRKVARALLFSSSMVEAL
jgi:prolyl-tRNA editing enzyme YbaK/EbsC (Cys-tRNA(Pro) deacylase)